LEPPEVTKRWEPVDRAAVVGLLDDPARAAAAAAAHRRVRAGMTVGLGSGRALWATMELLERRDDLVGLHVVASSLVTERLAVEYGFNVVALDGVVRPDLCIDGADEVAPDLSLMKGRGAALLREKLVAAASYRFLVVAEDSCNACLSRSCGSAGPTRADGCVRCSTRCRCASRTVFR